jgi:predicted RND superfamily exporter protein
MLQLLQVIMIARLHAMYQGSRTMLIFLVIIFLGISITCGVIAAIALKSFVAGKLYSLT